MLKKVNRFVLLGLLILNSYGCFALLGAAAGGAGTAVWLSGKMTQQFNASYDHTITASENALQDMGIKIEKKTQEGDISQLKSTYPNGKEVWIDISKLTDTTTKVEVRVGVIKPDKEAATNILKKIEASL